MSDQYNLIFEDIMVETAEILYGQATNETLAWIYQIMCDNKLKKAYIKQRDIYIDETPICLCPRGQQKHIRKMAFGRRTQKDEVHIQPKLIVSWAHLGLVVVTEALVIICYVQPDEDYINLVYSYIYNDINLWLRQKRTNIHFYFLSNIEHKGRKLGFLLE